MGEPRQLTLVKIIKDYGTKLSRFIRAPKSAPRKRPKTFSRTYGINSARLWIWMISIALADGYFALPETGLWTNTVRKKNTSLEDLLFEEDGGLDFSEFLVSEDASAEEEYFKDLFWDELNQALNELPENQKNAFVWNEIDGMTLQEIADKTGQKLKTIISRKRYAVKHLKEHLRFLYEDLNS